MTLNEVREEVKATLGNRSDLTSARLLSWVDLALQHVVSYQRKRVFGHRGFHVLQQLTHFATSVISNDVGSLGNTTSRLHLTGIAGEDDAYNNYVVKIVKVDSVLEGQVRVIYDYTKEGNLADISEVLPSAPINTDTVELYKRLYSLETDFGADPADDIYGIEKIIDMDDSIELEQVNWDTLATKDWTASLGEPTKFARRGDSIMFDPTPNTVKHYHFYYYRMPAKLVEGGGTTELEIPRNWHDAVVLNAVWRGRRALQEHDVAVQAWSDFTTFIDNIVASEEIEGRFVQGSLEVRKE
jgi:hypothetical protein